MRSEVLNFICENSDIDTSKQDNSSVLDLIKKMENVYIDDMLNLERYCIDFKLSQSYSDFVSENVVLILYLLNLKSSIISEISIQQFETFYSNYLFIEGDNVVPIKLCWVRVSYSISRDISDFILNYRNLSEGMISVSSVIYNNSGKDKGQMISCFIANPDNSIY